MKHDNKCYANAIVTRHCKEVRRSILSSRHYVLNPTKNIISMKHYKFQGFKKIKLQSFLVTIIFLCIVNESVSQVQVPFKQRTSVYSPGKKIYNIKGDFQMLGNTNMTLETYSSTTGNGNTNMIYVDIDGDPGTINSSSAILGFSAENGADPTCSNIIYAGLYWTGRAHDDTYNSVESPNSFFVPDGGHHNVVDGMTYGGYTLTITQSTQSGIGTAAPRYATYTFIPIGGGDAVVFRYNTWQPFLSSWQSSLTVQIGSGSQMPITDYSESKNNISIASFSTPYMINTGGAPLFIYGFKKHRANNNTGTDDFSVDVASSYKLMDKRQVKIKHASAPGYQTIMAKSGDIHYPTNKDGFMYAGYAEVTDYVKQYGIGSYAVADIALAEGDGGGTGFFGGWSMVVVYENSKMTWRDVTVFDGYAYVAGSTTISHELPVSGFNTAQSGIIQMKLGIVAGEGDNNITGDYFEIRPHANPNSWFKLSHAGSASGNFFNSSIQTGGNVRNPNLLNNSGMDIAMFNIPNANNLIIANNQTSTTFRYGSTQDTYIIFCIAMAVDAYVPAIETTNKLTEVNDIEYSSGAVLPGDIMKFEMDIKNKGSEGVNGLEYVLPIPYTTTYIDASAIYVSGISGTVTYDPTRGATGAIIWKVDSVPVQSNKDQVVAKLTYKLRVTTDCSILSNPLCPPTVINEGVFTGIGAMSGIAFSEDRFILGYKPSPCDEEPVYGALLTPIDRAAFIAENCSGGTGYTNRTFYYCDDSDTALPYADIANNFPVGTRFYDDIDFIDDLDNALLTNIVVPSDMATEYTAVSGFPKIGMTYYAIPPGSKNICYWEFDITYLPVPEIIVDETSATICVGDTIDLEDLLSIQGIDGNEYDDDIKYTVTFYDNAAGTKIITPIVTTDTTRSYWVRVQIENSLCVSTIEEIVITVNTLQVASITSIAGAVCLGSETLAASVTEASSYQWFRNGVEVLDSIQSTLIVTETGDYTVRYFNGTCISQISEPVSVPGVIPDVVADPTISDIYSTGNTITVTVGFYNEGDAPIGSPVYLTLYKDGIASENKIITTSSDIVVDPGNTGYVTVIIPDITAIGAEPVNIVARINDNGVEDSPYQMECDFSDNTISFANPQLMKKEATLILMPAFPDFKHNGTYPNPVSVLYNEEIKYEITAVNTTPSTGTVIITDTIPAYLEYVSGTATTTDVIFVSDKVAVNHVIYDRLMWTFSNVTSMDTITVSFNAKPVSGAVASQPLFINHAWVKLESMPQIVTNDTYHQGAGISIMTFSAGIGGSIYNAGEQVLDYMTTPLTGVIIAPDEGYRFTGWSHDAYSSLRGVEVEARAGIILYDTLTVYGDVELHANFKLEEYPVRYYLNGSDNSKTNPSVYTIKSENITLEAPEKEGDTFLGWTGSNGEKPQQSVVIANGSTGELVFYANFLYSGREDVEPEASVGNDNAWTVNDDLYIRTSKAGSIVRIFSLDGILREQRTIVSPGISTMKYPRGIYVVTINNSIGRKIKIAN